MALDGKDIELSTRLSFSIFVLTCALWVTSSVAVASNHSALGDEDLAKQECGSCHFYFSKEFLPAFSWKVILDNLGDHFGEDASLDTDIRERILTYMAAGRSMEIPLRITETGWWKNAHGSSWKMIGAKSNVDVTKCGNCHRQ